MNIQKKEKIGLALGGGGARGWAHIGVLQALIEKGITIDYLAGTSIGALIGAFFVTGNLPVLEDMAETFNKLKALRFFDPSWSKQGFLAGRRVTEFIRQYCGDIRLEDLPIPFAITAVDLHNGAEVVLRHGNLAQAVRASIAIPGLFAPVRLGSSLLVDGGMADPLPVKPVRDSGAEWIIGVDLNGDPPLVESPAWNHENSDSEATDKRVRRWSWSGLKHRRHRWQANWWEIAACSMIIMAKNLTQANLHSDPCELLIQPRVSATSTFDFHHAEEGVKAGYRAAKEILAEGSFVCPSG